MFGVESLPEIKMYHILMASWRETANHSPIIAANKTGGIHRRIRKAPPAATGIMSSLEVILRSISIIEESGNKVSKV